MFPLNEASKASYHKDQKKKKENLQPFLNKAYSAIFLRRAKAACYGRVAVATTLVGQRKVGGKKICPPEFIVPFGNFVRRQTDPPIGLA